jgi:adenine/guanine phosphoribosyltransferase-like PRPP-binding protein
MIHYDNSRGLSDLREIVQRTARDLEGLSFDSIVATGVSGLVVASPVSLMLGKPLVVVRKDNDRTCWHVSPVENAQHAGRSYLFLDDYAGEGKTYDHVRSMMRSATSAKYTGTYEFMYKSFTPAGESPVKYPRSERMFA